MGFLLSSTKRAVLTGLFPGLERLRHYSPAWLRGDVLAGITVAAYLIPQCMAYGELAGVNPVAGLWDITAADMLSEFCDQLAARDITLCLARVKQDLYTQLKDTQLLDKLGAEHIFFTLHSAIEAFHQR